MSKVLITGTNSGIGFATALVLGRAGHTVFATMRNPERGAALRNVVEKERLPISIFRMDVDSDESVDAATAAVRAQNGGIDVLVNNAGIERAGSIEGLAFDDFKATMETNYFGPLRAIRAWLPEMRKRQSGCIINVTSVAGRISCSPLTPYSASKFALEALSEGLAQEVKPFNIRVAVVQPGIIDTAMARRIEDVPTDAAYPQVRRFGHMFEASLDRPTPPTIVAEKIREIIESGTEKLRHPVGPDAEAFLAWRASLSDEAWVEWGALGDDEWYERVAKDFGLDARAKQQATTGASASAIRAVV
jgi:NAD(P)-dependent dehydrogenase (short-subunit alcohol dehydrogenase family)